MALSANEDEYLQQVLVAANEAPLQLSDWERGFMSDQQKRYDEYQSDIFMSPKQWAIIDRVAEALGVEKPT